MKNLIISLVIIFAPLLRADVLKSPQGLEVSDSENLCYVLSLHNDSELPITSQEISSQIELRLRSLKIRPVDAFKKPDNPFLSVLISITKNQFNIHFQFFRTVNFTVAEKTYTTNATTWSDGTSGIHGRDPRKDPEFIAQATLKYVDQFATEYLKANGK